MQDIIMAKEPNKTQPMEPSFSIYDDAVLIATIDKDGQVQLEAGASLDHAIQACSQAVGGPGHNASIEFRTQDNISIRLVPGQPIEYGASYTPTPLSDAFWRGVLQRIGEASNVV